MLLISKSEADKMKQITACEYLFETKIPLYPFFIEKTTPFFKQNKLFSCFFKKTLAFLHFFKFIHYLCG